MTHKLYLIEDTETGLVDGYYSDNRDALEVAIHWHDRLGHPMIVKEAKNDTYLIDEVLGSVAQTKTQTVFSDSTSQRGAIYLYTRKPSSTLLQDNLTNGRERL
jgi:hypothetical protein